jgi:hypothetical protein
MSRHDFIQGTRFIFDAEVYVVKEVLLSGKLVLLNQTRGGEREASHQELTELWSANRLVFEALGERAIKQNDLPIPTAYTIADFSQLEDKYRKVAWRRYRLVRPILDLPRSSALAKPLTSTSSECGHNRQT